MYTPVLPTKEGEALKTLLYDAFIHNKMMHNNISYRKVAENHKALKCLLYMMHLCSFAMYKSGSIVEGILDILYEKDFRKARIRRK